MVIVDLDAIVVMLDAIIVELDAIVTRSGRDCRRARHYCRKAGRCCRGVRRWRPEFGQSRPDLGRHRRECWMPSSGIWSPVEASRALPLLSIHDHPEADAEAAQPRFMRVPQALRALSAPKYQLPPRMTLYGLRHASYGSETADDGYGQYSSAH